MNLKATTEDTDSSTPFSQSRIEASLNSESFEVPHGLSAVDIQNFILSKAETSCASLDSRGAQ